MKLICDAFNGDRFQWKYLQLIPGYPVRWYDYGPSFRSRKSALEWYDNLRAFGRNLSN